MSVYIQDMADQIRARVSAKTGQSAEAAPGLLLAYAALAYTKGAEATAEDVHDTRSGYRAATEPDDPGLVWFANLSVSEQARNEPYLEAIRALGTRIAVYHNLSPDSYFGVNQVFTGGGEHGKQYQSRSHPLVRVFEFRVGELPDPDVTRPVTVADMIYRCFNVGGDPEFAGSGVMAERETMLAMRYRARRLRSMSKGDVLRFGDRSWLACDSYWYGTDEAELNIVTGAAAEQAIRDRYQFGPAEPLAISVPL